MGIRNGPPTNIVLHPDPIGLQFNHDALPKGSFRFVFSLGLPVGWMQRSETLLPRRGGRVIARWRNGNSTVLQRMRAPERLRGTSARRDQDLQRGGHYVRRCSGIC